MKNQGIPHDQFDGRPVIGICNTWSQATPCNAHFRELAQHVRDGVLDAGGFPIEFPVMSLGETLMRPTTMLFRNQAAMDVEESIRANPFDGVVLLMGCDKTTPALLMGAASCDLPTIGVSGGPMLNGKYRGEDIGSGTHVWKFTEMLKTGEMKPADMVEVGVVHVALGRPLHDDGHGVDDGVDGRGAGHGPAHQRGDSRRRFAPPRARAHGGRRIVEMVHEDLRMSQILTKEAFENAIMVNGAIGGSTNAVVHLLAIAGRIGVKLSLDDWDRLGRDMPCLVNLMPSGKYLMEDFYYAGGLPVVIREIGKYLHKKALTVNGKTIWDNCKDAVNYNEKVITPLAKPFKPQGGIAVLRGNLAPNGCVLKPSAATPKLMKHKGRAVVFEDIDDLHKRIDDPKLDVDAIVRAGAQELRAEGLSRLSRSRQLRAAREDAEEGRHRHGPHLRCAHVGHRVRHRRAAHGAGSGGRRAAGAGAQRRHRSSSTSRSAGSICTSPTRSSRGAEPKWKPLPPHADRGWVKLYCDTVLQADRGVDLDFLVGKSGAKVGKVSHSRMVETEAPTRASCGPPAQDPRGRLPAALFRFA